MSPTSSAIDSSPAFYKRQYSRVELLTAHNNLMWSSAFPILLKADKTWNIVQGTEKAPEELQLQKGSSMSRAQVQTKPLDDKMQRRYTKDLNKLEDKGRQSLRYDIFVYAAYILVIHIPNN
jgi:hypothetical protein